MDSVAFYRGERAHARPSETRPSRNGNRQAMGSACLKAETGLKAQGAGPQVIGEDGRRKPGAGQSAERLRSEFRPTVKDAGFLQGKTGSHEGF